MGEWEESSAGVPERFSVCSVAHRRTASSPLFSRLDLSPVKRLLAAGLRCICWLMWGWGCLAPAVPVSAVRGKERGPAAHPALPGVCGFSGAGFVTAALGPCSDTGFGERGAERRSGSGQGEVGTVAAASTGKGLALMSNHGAPSAPCAPSLGSGSRPALP